MAPPLAQAALPPGCGGGSGYSATFSTPNANSILMGPGAGSVAFGELTVTASNCVSTGGDVLYFESNAGPTGQATTVAGLNVLSAGLPKYTMVGGAGDSCTFNSEQPSWHASRQTILFNFKTVSAGGCRFTVTYIFEFQQTGAFSGFTSIDPANLTPPSGCTNFTQWVGVTTASFDTACVYGVPIGQSVVVQAVAHTCAVNSPTVTLPTIPMADFNSSTTAGLTPFNLQLSSCTGSGYPVNATWYYSTASNLPTDTAIANATESPAANVYAQILDGSRNVISDGQSTQLVGSVQSGQSSYSIPFYAQYLNRGGAAGAGKVLGLAYLTLGFQ